MFVFKYHQHISLVRFLNQDVEIIRPGVSPQSQDLIPIIIASLHRDSQMVLSLKKNIHKKKKRPKMKSHPFVVHQWTTPFPPPKKKKGTNAPFFSGDPVDGLTLVDFPNWNLRITKPHGVGPRVLRDGDFFKLCGEAKQKKNTVEVFLPFKSWKANSAEKNWNDSFQKRKKKEHVVKLWWHVSTVWPFIQEFLQLVWTLHTSTDLLLHMTGAQQTASSRPRKMDTSWELWENIHHVALWKWHKIKAFNHSTIQHQPNHFFMSPWTSAAEVCPFDAFSSRLCCDSQIQKQQPKTCGQPPIDDIINASGWVPQQFGTAKLAIRASCGG